MQMLIAVNAEELLVPCSTIITVRYAHSIAPEDEAPATSEVVGQKRKKTPATTTNMRCTETKPKRLESRGKTSIWKKTSEAPEMASMIPICRSTKPSPPAATGVSQKTLSVWLKQIQTH